MNRAARKKCKIVQDSCNVLARARLQGLQGHTYKGVLHPCIALRLALSPAPRRKSRNGVARILRIPTTSGVLNG